MRPSVGRIVHYVSYGTPGGEYGRECRAAVITEVQSFKPGSAEEARSSEVGLCVLNPTGQFFNRTVPYDPGQSDAAEATNLCDGLDYRGGSWHWPERV